MDRRQAIRSHELIGYDPKTNAFSSGLFENGSHRGRMNGKSGRYLTIPQKSR